MMNRSRKSRRFSKSDVFNAIATISSMRAKYSTFLAFNHFFSSNSSISVRIERRKDNWNSNSISLSFSQLLCHQIENCELYEIKFLILKTANSEIIKSCFFWVTHEDDFQIFNADWLWIEKNNRCEDHDDSVSSNQWIRCEDHDDNDFSNQHIRCENHDDNVSSNQYVNIQTHKLTNLDAEHMKEDHLKKLRC